MCHGHLPTRKSVKEAIRRDVKGGTWDLNATIDPKTKSFTIMDGSKDVLAKMGCDSGKEIQQRASTLSFVLFKSGLHVNVVYLMLRQIYLPTATSETLTTS